MKCWRLICKYTAGRRDNKYFPLMRKLDYFDDAISGTDPALGLNLGLNPSIFKLKEAIDDFGISLSNRNIKGTAELNILIKSCRIKEE
jgi:hypothetical protein